jgi:hypothetical protein
MITALTLAASLMVSPAAATKPITFGKLTIQVPAKWKVKKHGGGYHVLTGGCSKRAAECDGFWLLGKEAIKYAKEAGPYALDHPYHPSTGVMYCVKDKRYWSSPMPQKPSVTGYKQVGDRKAHYTEWKITCSDNGRPTKVTYPQRLWYLPKSKLLVVDEFKTPGLARILKAAAWS